MSNSLKKHFIKTFKVLMLLTILLNFNYKEVKAETLHVNRKSSNRIYYRSSEYTYYNKKIGDTVAYCTQLGKPISTKNKKDTSYSGYTNKWDPLDYKALVSGEIVRLSGGTDNKNTRSEYKKIQERLNCYLKQSGYYKGGCTSSNKKVIETARKNVKNYGSGRSSKKLPSISFSGSKNMVSTGKTGVYKSSAITLKGLKKEYGGDGVSYTISVDGNGYICSSDNVANSAITTECTKTKKVENTSDNQVIYIYVTGGGTEGGKVKITAKGENSSKYPSARLWRKSKSVQSLVTYRTVEVKREVTASYTVSYSKANRYTASLEKVDQNGENLNGAELTLFTSSSEDGSDDRKEICKISGTNTECSKNDIVLDDNTYKYSNNRYLCYEETKVPDGYIKINTGCTKISIGDNSTIYRDTSIENEDSQDISKDLYDKYTYANSDNGGDFCIYSTGDEITDEYINSQISAGDGGAIIKGKDTCPSSVQNGEETVSVTSTQNICMYAENSYYKYGGSENANAEDICRQHTLVSFQNTSGSIAIQAMNSLNSVNISKKAITGDDEIPGATLSIYKTDTDGKCTNELAKSSDFVYQNYDPTISENDASDSNDDSSSDSGDDVEEDVEPEGSVDPEDEYVDENPAQNGLKWISSYTPATVYGLKSGTYCLVEEIAPSGYKKVSSTTKFKIDDNNSVTLVDAGASTLNKEKNSSDTVVLHDELTKISVSKTDIATSKELPGANLSICETYVDEDTKKVEALVADYGNCTVVTLANGEPASWVSGDKPHEIVGLPSGTYYLVETTSPDGYDTAESILFTLKEDGTLVDKEGNSLKDNKIVMQDKPLTLTKTGQLKIILVFLIATGGISTYVYFNRKKNNININNDSNGSSAEI